MQMMVCHLIEYEERPLSMIDFHYDIESTLYHLDCASTEIHNVPGVQDCCMFHNAREPARLQFTSYIELLQELIWFTALDQETDF